jgi:cobalamin synthase
MSAIQRYGKSIVAYIVIGLLLGMGISLIVYGISLFTTSTASALTTMHETGMNATGKSVSERVYVRIGNDTVSLSKPSNPSLSSIFSNLVALLAVIGGALTSVTILAVLIALNVITISQDEE